MEERYRLQYAYTKGALFINLTSGKNYDYESGDCVVRAVQEKTNVEEHNKFEHGIFSSPMTLDKAKEYISQNREMLGKDIHRCFGLSLEDCCDKIEFNKPIQF